MTVRRRVLGALTVAAALLAAGAGASTLLPVPGQESPAFHDAVDRWLDGREDTGIEALAGLARAGNTAAQVLLALIDKSPDLQGPWLAALPRDGRIGLMRAEGGMSGTSWMRVAAKTSPLARAWVRFWDIDPDPGLVAEFAALGEDRAAREAVVVLAARHGTASLARIRLEPGFPQSMRRIAGATQGAGADRWQTDADVLASGATLPLAELDAWLAAAPEAAPLAAFCAARCPADTASCGRALYGAMEGFQSIAVFGSPAATLIPEDRFAASARGQAALLRRVLLGRNIRGRALMATDLAAQSVCLAAALEAADAAY